MSTEMRKWGDDQQYVAAPMEANRDDGGNIIPKVTLTWMTPDPLGANAAMGRMYKGIPTYSMEEITDEERAQYFQDSLATHLKAPLESIKFHFFIEGVTRSFTHQMVRQRTAVYAQESMRFAVKEDLAKEISLPPSLAALPPRDHRREKWDNAIAVVSDTYNYLIANGIPAEDARGLAPHATTTRLNYITDLRNLAEHAGNRLCTQAQFEWRIVFMGIVQAIRDYTPDFSFIDSLLAAHDFAATKWEERNRWQFEMLANSELFRPICYQLNRCPFKASFDRACTIRDRVDMNAGIGRPSSEWDKDAWDRGIGSISPAEWLLNPAAARKTSGGAGHD